MMDTLTIDIDTSTIDVDVDHQYITTTDTFVSPFNQLDVPGREAKKRVVPNPIGNEMNTSCRLKKAARS